MRPAPNPKILNRLEALYPSFVIAAPVWHELLFGVHLLPPSRKRQKLETYLALVIGRSLPILPYDRRAAAWLAAERARLSRIGKAIAFADGQIAAIARVNDLILVTANRSHFEVFSGLSLVDWRD
jgi:tRNA(fMet)-specific endonuclease VapC